MDGFHNAFLISRIDFSFYLSHIYAIRNFPELVIGNFINLLNFFRQYFRGRNHIRGFVPSKPFPMRYFLCLPPVSVTISVTSPFGAVKSQHKGQPKLSFYPAENIYRMPVMPMQDVKLPAFSLTSRNREYILSHILFICSTIPPF